MALEDERVEVFRLLLGEPVEPEVVEDEELRDKVAAEGGLEAVGGAGLSQFAQEGIGATEEDGVRGVGGGGSASLGQEGLADADGTDEEDVFSTLEELERAELAEVAAVDLDGGRPVEGLQGDALLDVGGE